MFVFTLVIFSPKKPQKNTHPGERVTTKSTILKGKNVTE